MSHTECKVSHGDLHGDSEGDWKAIIPRCPLLLGELIESTDADADISFKDFDMLCRTTLTVTSGSFVKEKRVVERVRENNTIEWTPITVQGSPVTPTCEALICIDVCARL